MSNIAPKSRNRAASHDQILLRQATRDPTPPSVGIPQPIEDLHSLANC
jgi:hypothetical protein